MADGIDKDKFLSDVTKAIMENPSAKVLVLIDNDYEGLKFFFNYGTFPWLFGIIKNAEEVVRIRHSQATAEITAALYQEEEKGTGRAN